MGTVKKTKITVLPPDTLREKLYMKKVHTGQTITETIIQALEKYFAEEEENK